MRNRTLLPVQTWTDYVMGWFHQELKSTPFQDQGGLRVQHLRRREMVTRLGEVTKAQSSILRLGHGWPTNGQIP